MAWHVNIWDHTNPTTHGIIYKLGNILLGVNHLLRVGTLLGQLTERQDCPFPATLESVVPILGDFKFIVDSSIRAVLTHSLVIQQKWEEGASVMCQWNAFNLFIARASIVL